MQFRRVLDLAAGGFRRSARARFALVAAVLLGMPAAFPGTTWALTVKSSHPRILFYADSPATVRARCAGPNASLYQSYKTWVDSQLQRPDRHTSYYLPDYAAMYLISGDATYSDAVIPIAMQMARTASDVKTGPTRISVIAIAYDWCYDRFTPAQRDTVGRFIASLTAGTGFSGQPWRYYDTGWFYALAIAGDAVNDTLAASWLQKSVNQLTQFHLPCLDMLAPGGAIDGYAGLRVASMLAFGDCLRAVTDVDPMSHSPYYQNSPQFWRARLRPDMLWARMPAKYNVADTPAREFFSFFASRLGDPTSQAVANTLMQRDHTIDRQGMLTLLWYNPTLPAPPLSQTPLDFYDSGMGFFLTRTGWTLGTGSDDITAAFFNGPNTQGENTQNHYFISRGQDNLIIDSGSYQHDLDDHFNPYYGRAIAHNTVLIYDPAETWPVYTDYWSDPMQIPNDGGQTIRDRGAGEFHWPLCNGVMGYDGEIKHVDQTAEHVIIDADATGAYAAAKADLVLRRWIYLRPNWFVVQDRIRLAKPGLAVRSLVHCIPRPRLDVPLQAIEGDSTKGGIFRAPGAHQIIIDYDNSSARIYPLQMEGGTGEVRVVGGSAADGLPWRQQIQPRDSLTYEPNGQSYEFWVDGKNYPPGGPGMKHSQGQRVIDHRNDPGPNTAGDWRVEFLVEGAQSEVRISYLVQVVPIGTPMATVTSATHDDAVSVSVRSGGEEFHLGLCAPGLDCTPLTYEH